MSTSTSTSTNTQQQAEKTAQWLAQSQHHHVVRFDDAHYPPLLKQIPDPPAALYVRGDVSILQRRQMAIVGSRKPTPAGVEAAQQFARELTQQGWLVVSGLAQGIDGAAHGAVVGLGEPTVAVMGTGIDRIYPHRHQRLAEAIVEKGGALVTEFEVGMPPIAHHFPRRNRIISGLSRGTLVIEATQRSGSLITARLANEQGKEVFAVPGSIYNPLSRGCHFLIQDGAKLVENVDDVLTELRVFEPQSSAQVSFPSLPQVSPQSSPTKKTRPMINVPKPSIQHSPSPPQPIKKTAAPQEQLDTKLQKLLECIGFEITAVDVLMHRSGFQLTEVLSGLAILQAQGYVVQSMAGYALTSPDITL
jgi:DNA processing protein